MVTSIESLMLIGYWLRCLVAMVVTIESKVTINGKSYATGPWGDCLGGYYPGRGRLCPKLHKLYCLKVNKQINKTVLYLLCPWGSSCVAYQAPSSVLPVCWSAVPGDTAPGLPLSGEHKEQHNYTGWPRKNGTAYFVQCVDAITDVSVWGNFSWEKWYQDL